MIEETARPRPHLGRSRAGGVHRRAAAAESLLLLGLAGACSGAAGAAAPTRRRASTFDPGSHRATGVRRRAARREGALAAPQPGLGPGALRADDPRRLGGEQLRPLPAGAFQINLWADSTGFREIGRYFLALAELDTSVDNGFHQHHEITSTDGRTHVHLIVRKPQM